ncbi:MAG TPA: 50S ribosomal protein L4 [Catalimonadaceae bacterium]|jgi:large subunit ribosomal protein L4|nr:50S ribosomal protein L4 [Catalimonadaceae bacterium]HPI10381.1 50S ribosomal protein L4 [Catalimonadaceae bacterium]
MNLSVINKEGQNTGRSVSLPDSIFAIAPNEHAVYLDVKHHLANQRQGTHKAKERAEIARTTKKLKKQKGTGGARAGSMKSPVFVGGGRIFGPRPRDYDFKLNKKVKDLARKSILSAKATEGKIALLEAVAIGTPSTKEFNKILKAISLAGKKSVFYTSGVNSNFYLSGRNIPSVTVLPIQNVNTYDLINSDMVVFEEGAVEILQTILS